MVEPRNLLVRLLSAPDIARVVPVLPPEVLHRVIERCGLEACAEILALATPGQLQRVLDLDLWRAPAPGREPALDGERFGEWIEMLTQAGAEIAIDRLTAMDIDLVVGGLAGQVAVFDAVAVAGYTTLDGEEVPGRRFSQRPVSEIGGFVVEAKRTTAWDAIVELLTSLQAARPALFHRVMRGCVGLSDGAREQDGFHALADSRDQHMADLGFDREARRDREGYVAPVQARAFLQAARGIRLAGPEPLPDPFVSALLRSVTADSAPEAPAGTEAAMDADPPPADAGAVATVMDILAAEGVVTQPRALLPPSTEDEGRLALVRAFAASDRSAMQELAFLMNVLVAGCALQGRPFTPQEASDAVTATCNLGLENYPAAWRDRTLVQAFQIGWTILHQDLCVHAAAALIDVLAGIECSDRDAQWSLQALRQDLIRHVQAGEPWRARDALEALLMLDAPAWAVLRTMIDECPTLHALVGASRRMLTVDPSAFGFVSRNAEIAAARVWLTTLTATLAG